MRVTNNNLYSASQQQINEKREKLMEIQTELSTQKRINKPSDDPIGTAKLLDLRVNDKNLNQFKETADTAKIFLNYSDTAMAELSDIVLSLKDLAISQSSSASANESTRKAIAGELEQLYNQTLSVANRKFGNRYIFGGYNTVKAPFDSYGNYFGDNGSIRLEINENTYLPINIPGSKIFYGMGNINGEIKGENVFDVIKVMHDGLMTNDTKIIQTCIERLDKFHEQVVEVRATIGARAKTIDGYKDGIEKSIVDNVSLKSEIEDSDIVKAASELKKEENILSASLNVTNRLLQPSLMDFLR